MGSALSTLAVVTGAEEISNAWGTLGDQLIGIGITTAVTASAAAFRWRVLMRQPSRRAWRYTDPSKLVIVVSSSATVDTGEYKRPTTGIGQIRALAILAPSLTRAYQRMDLERIRMSAQHLGHELENDLLILGGPKTNECAKRMFDRLAPRLPFTMTGSVIDWGGTRYEGSVRDQAVTRDVGYIVRAANPISPRHRIVMLGGSHTYGVVAAARWFTEHGGDRAHAPDLAVLVESDVMPGDHVAPPDVVHCEALV